VVAGLIGARSMRAVFFLDALGLGALALATGRQMASMEVHAAPGD
jgi:hypothetical protein